MKNLVFDGGHGNGDSGAIGFDGVTLEKDLALSLCIEMYKILSPYVPTYLTRQVDETFAPTERVRKIKEHSPCNLFSMHFNAFDNKSRGIEIFTSQYGANNKEFATFLCKEFSKQFGIPNRGQKVRKNSEGNDYYYVHRLTGENVTCYLVETCFLDNVDDLVFINSTDMIKKIARFYSKHILAVLYNITLPEPEPETNPEIEKLIEKLNAKVEECNDLKIKLEKIKKYIENQITEMDYVKRTYF